MRNLSSICAGVLLASSLAFGHAEGLADASAKTQSGPSISISSVTDNGLPAPANLVIHAVAAAQTPGTVISEVDFYQGSQLLGKLPGTSLNNYDFAWYNVAAGTYQITAKAIDSQGASKTSNPPTTVIVAAPVPAPKVTLTIPASGLDYTAPADIPLAATVVPSSTGSAVTQVDYYAGSTLIGSSNSPPFSVSWHAATGGQYYVTAKATDASQATGVSTGVTFTVNDNFSCHKVGASGANQAVAVNRFLQSPLEFFPKAQGQEYFARAPGYAVQLTPTSMVLSSAAAVSRSERGVARPERIVSLRTQLVGASTDSRFIAEDPSANKVNYLIGAREQAWRTSQSAYRQLRAAEVYPGIDEIFHGSQQKLEVDFVVKPGADAARIGFEVAGATGVELRQNGNLVVRTAEGVLEELAPSAFQERGGVKRRVEVRYRRLADNRIGFQVGSYDRANTLVIDPVILYATYFGGTDNGTTAISGVAMGQCGEAYIYGATTAADLPVTTNRAPPIPPGVQHVVGFIARVNQSGTGPIYSTYLGSSGDTLIESVAVDAGGNAYVAGSTIGGDFPTTAGSYHPAPPADTTVKASFLTKLSTDGSSLAYSTYLPGADVAAVAVGSDKSLYVTGSTPATLPTTTGAYDTRVMSRQTAFVTRLSANGSSLVYSTYLGGTTGQVSMWGTPTHDLGTAIAVDAKGNVFVVGETTHSDFPTTAKAFTKINPLQASSEALLWPQPVGFVTKLAPKGDALIWSTLVSTEPVIDVGDGGDNVSTHLLAVALDADGAAYIAGQRASWHPLNNPTSNSILTKEWLGATITNQDRAAFVSKVHLDGSTLDYFFQIHGELCDNPPLCSIFGPGIMDASSIAVDANKAVYFTGSMTADPMTYVMPIAPKVSGSNGYLAELLPDLTLKWFTPLAVSNSLGVGLSEDGSVFVAGYDYGTSLPVTPGAFKPTRGKGEYDGFLMKLNSSHDVTVKLTGSTKARSDAPATLTATVTGRSPTGTIVFNEGATVLGEGQMSTGSASINATLSGGQHTLTANYSGDEQNNPGTGTLSYTVSTANQPPTATLTGPAPNGGTVVTNSTNVQPPNYSGALSVNVTAAPGNTLKSVDLVDDATTYDYTFDVFGNQTTLTGTANPQNVAIGPHTYRVVAKDNLGTLSNTTTLAFGIVPPGAAQPTAVSMTAPADGTTNVAPVNITLKSKATAAAGSNTTVSVQYYANGTLLGGGAAASPYTYTWSSVAAGTYSVMSLATAKRADGTIAGLTYSKPITITITPAVGQTGNKTTTMLAASPPIGAINLPTTLVATVSGNQPTGSVTFLDNGNTLDAKPVPLSGDSARYTWTPDAKALGMPHSLTANYLSDNQTLNKNSTSPAVNYVVGDSQTAPTVTLAGITDGTALATNSGSQLVGQNVTLGATAANGNVISTDQLVLSSVNGQNTWTWGLSSNVFSTLFTLPALDIGQYTLSNSATDNYNNQGKAAPLHFVVNPAGASAPTVQWTSPASGAQAAVGATVQLTATATTSGSITAMQLYDGDTQLAASTGSQSTLSFQWRATGVGSHTLYAVATNSAQATKRVALPFTVIASTAPTVTLTKPANGAGFSTAPASVNLSATATATTGASITQVEFLQDGAVAATVTSATAGAYTASVSVLAGAHVFEARATDSNNQVTTSTAANVSVALTGGAPTVGITSPLPYDTFDEGVDLHVTASAFSKSSTIKQIDYYSEQGVWLAGSTTAPYDVVLRSLPAATYTIRAKATDNSATPKTSWSEDISFTVVQTTPLQLAITTPLSGATIADDHVLIRGTVHAPPNSAVSVNGQLGTLMPDGTFFIDQVPLVAGVNNLQVMIATVDGASLTSNLALTSTRSPGFKLSVVQTAGLLSLTTPVRLVVAPNTSFTHIDLYCGNGSPLSYKMVPFGTISATCDFQSIGNSNIRVKAYAMQAGQSQEQLVYSDSDDVYVESPLTRNRIVRGVWIELLSRLKLGQSVNALNLITWTISDKMATIFTNIGTGLPAAALQLGSATRSTLRHDSAELLLARPEATGLEGYSAEILRAEDGCWRIDDM